MSIPSYSVMRKSELSFGQRLKQARKERGLTQAQLAEKVMLATRTIQQYELGKRSPKAGITEKLSQALNVSYAWLELGLAEEDLRPKVREGAGQCAKTTAQTANQKSRKRTKNKNKLSDQDAYCIKMLDAERQYRAKTGGEDCDTPFVAPLLFRIHGTLRSILYSLSFLIGALLAKFLFSPGFPRFSIFLLCFLSGFVLRGLVERCLSKFGK